MISLFNTMHLLYLILLLILFGMTSSNDDLEKYRPLREKCERIPSDSECLKLKSKFLDLVGKCQKINTSEQLLVCQEIKIKLCTIFPSTCGQTTTTTKKPLSATKKRKITKQKLVTTIATTTGKSILTTTTKAKPVVTTTTTQSKLIINETMTNEEFVKVPINPDELRIRGEYCIRHGKEKKCQELLTNLKTTYSACGKKKAEVKPELIDCHSFQTHLCKAFPKFPPCLKKTATL